MQTCSKSAFDALSACRTVVTQQRTTKISRNHFSTRMARRMSGFTYLCTGLAPQPERGICRFEPSWRRRFATGAPPSTAQLRLSSSRLSRPAQPQWTGRRSRQSRQQAGAAHRATSPPRTVPPRRRTPCDSTAGASLPKVLPRCSRCPHSRAEPRGADAMSAERTARARPGKPPRHILRLQQPNL